MHEKRLYHWNKNKFRNHEDIKTLEQVENENNQPDTGQTSGIIATVAVDV